MAGQITVDGSAAYSQQPGSLGFVAGGLFKSTEDIFDMSGGVRINIGV